MKKHILFVMLAMISMSAFAQDPVRVTPNNGVVLNNLRLNSFPDLDTTRDFQLTRGMQYSTGSWAAQFTWWSLDTTGYSSDTIGTIWLQVSLDGVNYVYYTDSLNIIIDGTSGSKGFEDEMWNWDYGRFLIQINDTITAGWLKAEINY